MIHIFVDRYSLPVFAFVQEFLENARTTSGPFELVENGSPLHGPLSARIFDVSKDVTERVFNAVTLVFAGHDTTANMMTYPPLSL